MQATSESAPTRGADRARDGAAPKKSFVSTAEDTRNSGGSTNAQRETNVPLLPWKIGLERRENPLDERYGYRGCIGDIPIYTRAHNAHHRHVAPAVPERVQNCVEFGVVFACNDSTVRLIPVNDDVLSLASSDDISIYR